MQLGVCVVNMNNGMFLCSTGRLWPNVLSLSMVQNTDKNQLREGMLEVGCSLSQWEGKALRASLAAVAGT